MRDKTIRGADVVEYEALKDGQRRELRLERKEERGVEHTTGGGLFFFFCFPFISLASLSLSSVIFFSRGPAKLGGRPAM